MLLLVQRSPGSLDALRTPNLGILLGPRAWYRPETLDGWVWAADNDAFSGFDEAAYLRMLDRYQHVRGCRWVAAPDVVADGAATLMLFKQWGPHLRSLGFPAGLVGQDGMTRLPWDDLDCLFVGGSTEWKLGAVARGLVFEAKSRGKWVHMGRVNTLRRLRYAKSIGVDSVDGTQYSRFANTYLPRHLAFAAGDQQTIMPFHLPMADGWWHTPG